MKYCDYIVSFLRLMLIIFFMLYDFFSIIDGYWIEGKYDSYVYINEYYRILIVNLNC